MEKVLKYSVLRYSPSVLSGESINLGILFSEEQTGYHTFKYTTNIARILSFDDELDKKVLRELLEGIRQEVEGTWHDEQFDIENFVRFYINDYRFEKPHAVLYEDLQQMCASLYRSYFRFDYSKPERPNRSEDRELLFNIIRASGIKAAKNKKVSGAYDESVSYDIVTDGFYVKMFDYDGKDLKRCINSAKTWAWNCLHEKTKPVYVVYRLQAETAETSGEFQVIKKIFEESGAHFCSIDRGAELLA